MARYNPHSTVLTALQQLEQQDSQHQQWIKENHQLVKAAAGRLTRGGDIHKTLMLLSQGYSDIVSEVQVDDFLQEQRERLKQLTVENIQDQRMLENLTGALKALQQQIQSGQDVENFEDALPTEIERQRKQRESMLLPVEQETYHQQVCKELGESVPNDKYADEIEVVTTETVNNAGASLKCPLTTRWLEDPVRNSVCGHCYSRGAIMEYLQNGGVHCPVAGCLNRSLKKAQLEEDRATGVKVRRELLKEASAAKLRATQSDLVDSDDEAF